MTLSGGGVCLIINGVEVTTDGDLSLTGEYPRLYANMARLISDGGIDMDLAPMRLVADAFTLGQRVTVDAFVV